MEGDDGIKPRKECAFGITNRDKEWQLGMEATPRITLPPQALFLSPPRWCSLNSSYLSYTALGSDIPGPKNGLVILSGYCHLSSNMKHFKRYLKAT
ncbi:MAG: hypothetical protein U5M23_14650 [Marinagarivorans sp.]|nr:hypothetical protein [Marinagarivorans sp.]